MSDLERLVRFKLFGQDYTFYTGTSEEEMEEILDFIRKMIDDNNPGMPGTLPAGKVAVMACLNLASRFMKLNQDFDTYKKETERRIISMNKKLEELLSRKNNIK